MKSLNTEQLAATEGGLDIAAVLNILGLATIGLSASLPNLGLSLVVTAPGLSIGVSL